MSGAVQEAERRVTKSVRTLKGHSSGVTSVSFSPDGRRIVSGSSDKTVKVWDAQTGQETLTFKGDSTYVLSVSFSPDGKRIVSGGYDSTVKVWDAQTGQEMLTLRAQLQVPAAPANTSSNTLAVISVSFSPDGKRIVSGDGDPTYGGEEPVEIKVWDAQTGQETLTLKGHTGHVNSVSFSPDGKRIVSGSADHTLKVWDAQTGQEMLTLKGHSSIVYSVSFSPDGKRIVSGSVSGDERLKVWDVWPLAKSK